MTFYNLDLGTNAEGSITGVWTLKDGSTVDAIFAGGTTGSIDASDDVLVSVGDNVKSVTYTITATAGGEITYYTFYFNGFTAPTE